MHWWVVAGVILAILCLVPITVVAKLRWNRDEKGVILEIRFGLPFIGFEKAWLMTEAGREGITITDETEVGRGAQAKERSATKSLADLRRSMARMQWMRGWLATRFARRTTRLVSISKISWLTTVSATDPSGSAILVGIAWAVKGMLLSGLTSRIRTRNLVVEVWPASGEFKVESNLDCIVKTSIAHIIVVGIALAASLAAYELGQLRWLLAMRERRRNAMTQA